MTEPDHAEAFEEDDSTARIRTVNLENRLGQIDADRANVTHAANGPSV